MQQYTIQIPDECHHCQGATFKIWGTAYPDETTITVRCIRCGNPQHQIHATTPRCQTCGTPLKKMVCDDFQYCPNCDLPCE